MQNRTRDYCFPYHLALTASFGLMFASVANAFDDHDFSPEARKKIPFAYSIGGYFLTVGSGLSTKVGTDFWSSYRYPVGTFDFRTTNHSQQFSLTDASGNENYVSIAAEGFDALYRLNAFYFGPGVTLVTQTANTFFFPFSHPWETVFGFTAGFDITQRIFVEVVWQAFGSDPYRGVALGAGYRF